MATPSPRRGKPWDRQPEESDAAWLAFKAYRDLGLTRSLSKVIEQTGKSRSNVGGWSSKHSWLVRCRAWDAEQDRLWQLELRVARKEAAKRNMDLAAAMKNLAAGGVMRLVQSQEKLKAQDVARLMEVATKIESLALGAATEIVAPGPGAATADRSHVEHLSDEDRRVRMQQLQQELTSRLNNEAVDF